MNTSVTVAQKENTGVSYRNVEFAASSSGGGVLIMKTFGEVIAFAEIMARSKHAIPAHLRDNPGACMAVTMQAMRWEMDPFVVASKSYNVKDLIAYEAQLVAALVHTRAPIKSSPDYAYTGEGNNRVCHVSCEMLDGKVKVYESPKIGTIPVKNSPLWKGDPDQQLGYYSIRAWARRYTPEVILGVYTPEERVQQLEANRARDVTPRPSLASRLQPSTATEGFSTEHVDRETGEILDGQPSTASAETESDQPDSTDEPGAEHNDDDLPDDLTILERAQAKTMEGFDAWKTWKDSLPEKDRRELMPHMSKLIAAAKQADGAAA